MIAWTATLETTAFLTSQFPKAAGPEIALAGRSNVGKSSLLNCLVGQKLAHVGSAPGKTRSVNFFRVNCAHPFTLVDLPGFGFASRSKDERAGWAKLIENYVARRGELALVFHLVDLRHGLLAKDRELQEWLHALEIPVQVVFTKADKIARSKRKGLILQYVEEGLFSWNLPLACSANEPMTVDVLREQIELYLASGSYVAAHSCRLRAAPTVPLQATTVAPDAKNS